MKRQFLLPLILVAALLSGCKSNTTSQPTKPETGREIPVSGGFYTDISADELNTWLMNKNFTFINVHIPFEGNIAKTDLSIPYDQISQTLDKLPPDKSAKIVLYCRSGRMSTIAAETLVGLGYTNVWNLAGGMQAWEKAGLIINR